MNINELFTQRFNEVIKNSGKTQIELALTCHLSKQSITDFKKGRAYPSITTLYLLCKALDCTSDYLLGLSDY